MCPDDDLTVPESVLAKNRLLFSFLLTLMAEIEITDFVNDYKLSARFVVPAVRFPTQLYDSLADVAIMLISMPLECLFCFNILTLLPHSMAVAVVASLKG